MNGRGRVGWWVQRCGTNAIKSFISGCLQEAVGRYTPNMGQHAQPKSASNRRHERRNVHIEAHIEPESGADLRRLSVVVEDLSSTGARLRCPQSIEKGTVWRLWLGPGGSRLTSLPFFVHWEAGEEDGSWVCGVEFVVDPAVFSLCGIEAGLPGPGSSRDNNLPTGEPHVGVLHAQTLRAESLAYMNCHASGDVTLTKSAVHCSLDIEGGLRAPEASVVGGRVAAIRAVEVRELGDAEGTPTEVVLGSSARAEALLSLVPRELVKIGDKLNSMQAEREMLRGLEEPDHADRERLTEIEFEIAEVEAGRQTLESNESRLRAVVRKKAEYALTVHGTLHRGGQDHRRRRGAGDRDDHARPGAGGPRRRRAGGQPDPADRQTVRDLRERTGNRRGGRGASRRGVSRGIAQIWPGRCVACAALCVGLRSGRLGAGERVLDAFAEDLGGEGLDDVVVGAGLHGLDHA